MLHPFAEQPTRTNRPETGAAMLELTLGLTVMLLLIAGIVDLGLAICRYNIAEDAAKRATRSAGWLAMSDKSFSTDLCLLDVSSPVWKGSNSQQPCIDHGSSSTFGTAAVSPFVEKVVNAACNKLNANKLSGDWSVQVHPVVVTNVIPSRYQTSPDLNPSARISNSLFLKIDLTNNGPNCVFCWSGLNKVFSTVHLTFPIPLSGCGADVTA